MVFPYKYTALLPIAAMLRSIVTPPPHAPFISPIAVRLSRVAVEKALPLGVMRWARHNIGPLGPGPQEVEGGEMIREPVSHQDAQLWVQQMDAAEHLSTSQV